MRIKRNVIAQIPFALLCPSGGFADGLLCRAVARPRCRIAFFNAYRIFKQWRFACNITVMKAVSILSLLPVFTGSLCLNEQKLTTPFISGFDYLAAKGASLIGYVIMPNLLHTLLHLPSALQKINTIVSNGKRFIAYEIIKRLEAQGEEALLQKLHRAVNKRQSKRANSPSV